MSAIFNKQATLVMHHHTLCGYGYRKSLKEGPS